MKTVTLYRVTMVPVEDGGYEVKVSPRKLKEDAGTYRQFLAGMPHGEYAVYEKTDFGAQNLTGILAVKLWKDPRDGLEDLRVQLTATEERLKRQALDVVTKLAAVWRKR